MELLVLGSGTSQGVPAIGCRCATCSSGDPRDKRLRPSVLFRVGRTQLLVDTSSDFRQQMLRHGIDRIDAVLLTHCHFDHIGGFDDLRQYNVLQRAPMRVYGRADALDDLRITFRYAFGGARQEGGGIPKALLIPVPPGGAVTVDGVRVQTIPAMHGLLPILGYRIGAMAYLTDVSSIPDDSFAMLRDLDVLVLNALRHRAHPTHFSLGEAIEAARRIGARRTFFTHVAHGIHHERDSALLPYGMALAFDGLVLRSDDTHGDAAHGDAAYGDAADDECAAHGDAADDECAAHDGMERVVTGNAGCAGGNERGRRGGP